MTKKEFTIYYTSDLHGYFFPTTYTDRSPKKIGLFGCASQFTKDANTLIIDGGDVLQGSAFTAYCRNVLNSCKPVADMMNRCGYDFITLGNHDFNYGYKYLEEYLACSDAVCVCQNIRDANGHTVFPFCIKRLGNGLRVGIVGMITDYINVWEKRENLAGIHAADPFQCAREALERLRGCCDITVGIYHGGFERDLQTGRLLSEGTENIAYRICEELDFDILLTGHQHMSVAGQYLHGTFVVQPAENGREFLRLHGSVGDDGATVNAQTVAAVMPEEGDLMRHFAPIEDRVQQWLDADVGYLKKALPPHTHMEMALNGTGIAGLLNAAQLYFSGAQLSAASLANDIAGFRRVVRRRDILATYPYANTLVVIEITGKVLRAAVERSAEYFALNADGVPVVSETFLRPKVEHYNYDYYAGVAYRIDISLPVGSRVTQLRFQHREVQPEDVFTICLSNYRVSCAGGYDMYRGCRRLREISIDTAELVMEYFERGLQDCLPVGDEDYCVIYPGRMP